MNTLEIYDRPLCCSTGICGPSVDPALVHFAADLDWLRQQGVTVQRYNLAFQPGAFTEHEDVKAALRAEQTECLPLVRLNGVIVSRGSYPTREALARVCGLSTLLELPVEAPQGCCEGTCS